MTAAASDASVSPRGEHVILYDGVCGLCNHLINFVLPRDTRCAFDFAPLQGPSSRALLHRFGRDSGDLTTLYLVTNYRSGSPALLSKAEAALFIAKNLRGVWRWFGILAVFPTALLDRIYDLVASNRYRLFGRYESCLVPRAEYKKRFLDE